MHASARKTYSAAFYRRQQAGSRRSAKAVLPLVFQAVKPQSVVDVGCGVGTWLGTARELGAVRLAGYEGSWVKSAGYDSSIEIREANLEHPLPVDEQFDLAICMEVAEHISPARSAGLVDDLTALAPNVLFGAAIPGQGGTGHVNEKWQSEWAELFARKGYGARDIVRPKVWWKGGVEFWYRQNAILYSRGAPIVPTDRLKRVHPVMRALWMLRLTRYER